jgi:hypothetical protein
MCRGQALAFHALDVEGRPTMKVLLTQWRAVRRTREFAGFGITAGVLLPVLRQNPPLPSRPAYPLWRDCADRWLTRAQPRQRGLRASTGQLQPAH